MNLTFEKFKVDQFLNVKNFNYYYQLKKNTSVVNLS